MARIQYLALWCKWIAVAVAGIWMTTPAAVQTLIMLTGADLATGLAAAYVERRLDSRVGMRGLIRKCTILGLIFVFHLGERAIGLDLHIVTWLCAYFLVLELISITENCARMGIPIPVVLVRALVQVKRLHPVMQKTEVKEVLERAEKEGKE